MRAADYVPGSACPNCVKPLNGPFCAACGQHAHHSARGLGALLHDGWETLTHVDGRIWRTFGLLLLHPGELTLEYFRDRRARYLPPVRLYLIMSLVFFAAVGIDGTQSGFAPRVTASPGQHDQKPSEACNDVDPDLRALGALLRRSCLRSLADNGVGLKTAMQRNVPRMMFIFLPLLAACMSLLYWHPRRLYVQQLVFLLHTHAALYAALLLAELCDWLGARLSWLSGFAGLLALASVAYAIWYSYRAMRRVYGQRRGLTLLKLTLMSIAYGSCLVLLLLLTAMISAITT